MPGNPFSTLESNEISPLPKGNSLVPSVGTESVYAQPKLTESYRGFFCLSLKMRSNMYIA